MGTSRWKRIVAKTTAVAKLATGGKKYEQWLRDKAKQDEDFYDGLWEQAEKEVKEEEQLAKDSVSKFEQKVTLALSRKHDEHVYVRPRHLVCVLFFFVGLVLYLFLLGIFWTCYFI